MTTEIETEEPYGVSAHSAQEPRTRAEGDASHGDSAQGEPGSRDTEGDASPGVSPHNVQEPPDTEGDGEAQGAALAADSVTPGAPGPAVAESPPVAPGGPGDARAELVERRRKTKSGKERFALSRAIERLDAGLEK